MGNDATRRNWFYQGGQAYAQYRPDYPSALARFLADAAPSTKLAIDVGCGTGQLTAQLGAYFDEVLGLDPSADQVASAEARGNVRYDVAPAEHLPVAPGSASLITAAQAAHWFDLPAFYSEVHRIGAAGAVVALISYGVPTLEAPVDALFQRFYTEQIGPYWPPERKLVDSGYATIDFPFAELTKPTLAIERSWNLEQTLGYISTWSAVKRAADAGQQALLETFAEELGQHWGDAAQKREIRWPINMRIGTV